MVFNISKLGKIKTQCVKVFLICLPIIQPWNLIKQYKLSAMVKE